MKQFLADYNVATSIGKAMDELEFPLVNEFEDRVHYDVAALKYRIKVERFHKRYNEIIQYIAKAELEDEDERLS